MAERRMFAKSVIGSARFLRMPSTSRLLYYDLGMQADDDGVVEAFSVMRTTGATEDDLRVLASKGFISVLNDDLVSYITDWTVNNQLRKDRYHPSIYSGLLVQLKSDNQMETTGLPNGNQTETEVSIGKYSIDKSISPLTPRSGGRENFVPPTVEDVRVYCREKKYQIDPEVFVAFYESKGWMVGRNKMKDWRAAVNTWVKKRTNEQGSSGKGDPYGEYF